MRDHNSPPSAPATTEEQDGVAREQRLRVLHAIAERAQPLARPESVPLPRPEPAPTPRTPNRLTREDVWRGADRRRTRRNLFALGVGALLALLALGMLLHPNISLSSLVQVLPFLHAPRAGTTTTRTTGPLTIPLAHDDIGCPSDAAWSQGGTQIAVLGTTICAQAFSATNHVHINVYSAVTGKLQTQIDPDTVVQPAVRQAMGANRNFQFVSYEHVIWSQQGPLAVTLSAQAFDCLDPGSNPNNCNWWYSGVFLVDSVGGSIQLVLVQVVPEPTFAYHVLWDLTAKKASVTRNAVSGDQYSFSSLPPALSYGWAADGHLAVSASLPAHPDDTSAQAQAAAQPIGGSQAPLASIWQPGVLTYQPLGQGMPSTLAWNTDWRAWSPDNTHLLDAVSLQAILQPPGQPSLDTGALGNPLAAYLPILPVRDAGLQALISGLQSSAASSATSATVAWRPDGMMLAAQSAVPPTGTHPNSVAVFSCTSGARLATLQLPVSTSPNGRAKASSLLQWAPDGTRLSLYDPYTRVLLVWGSDTLPT